MSARNITQSTHDDTAAVYHGTDIVMFREIQDEAPLFISPKSASLARAGALPEWLQHNRDYVDTLLEHEGALVFRGFHITDTAEFEAVANIFEPYSGNYEGGGSPRSKLGKNVYEATQLAGHLKLMLHQEMTYTLNAPKKIIFYCRKPAEQGGETTIADMRRITSGLPKDLRDKIESKGALYIRNFGPPQETGQKVAEAHPDQRSWQDAFYTDDRAHVEAACREKGMDAVWLPDGGLMVRCRLPGFATHPRTGEAIYRTVLHNKGGRNMMTDALPSEQRRRIEEMLAAQQFKTGCYLGDGSELTDAEMETLDALFADTERAWDWQAGDIMLLDNLLMAHGRNPYQGTRDIQVALLD